MPFDAAELLAAERLHTEVAQELEFAKALNQPVAVDTVTAALTSAQADISEAYALVRLRDSGGIAPSQQATTAARIYTLAHRSIKALNDARQTAFPNSVTRDLFAGVHVRAQALAKQAADLGAATQQLAVLLPAIARPIREHLAEVTLYLEQANFDMIAGTASERTNDFAAAVARKQSVEAALDAAERILREDLRKLQAGPVGGGQQGTGQPGLGQPSPQPQPLAPSAQPQTPNQFATMPRQSMRRQPMPLQTTQTQFGRGVLGQRNPTNWINMISPHIPPGEQLLYVTSLTAELRSADAFRVLAFTDQSVLIVGNHRNGLVARLSRFGEITGFRTDLLDFLTIETPMGRIKVGNIDARDHAAVRGWFGQR